MPLKIQHDEQIHLNLTPMIDVVFLLIIFFMVATKFGEMDRNIDLELPKVDAAGQTSDTPPRPTIVLVFPQGRVELDGEVVTVEELTTRLHMAAVEKPDLQVVVQGDARCEFQQIAQALAACREAGVAELGITVHIASAASSRLR